MIRAQNCTILAAVLELRIGLSSTRKIGLSFGEMFKKSTQDATKCATWILDAKYKKADLQSVVRDNRKYQGANQQKKLLQLLRKYELLFDVTLCVS
jgi:hypothetical protein